MEKYLPYDIEGKGLCVRSTNNVAVFNGPERQKVLVHGDDLLMLATQKCIDEFEALLQKKFQLRKEWQIGFRPKDAKTGRILNRIITIEERPKRVTIEPDARSTGVSHSDFPTSLPLRWLTVELTELNASITQVKASIMPW